MNQFQSRTSVGPFGCLLFLGLVVGLVWGYVHFFKYLFIGALCLIALAFLVDWRVPAAWGRGLVAIFARNPISGIFGLLSAAAFLPFTSIAMFIHASNRKRIESWQAEVLDQNPFFQQFKNQQKNASAQPRDDEYADFEEIESKPKKSNDDQFLN